MNTINNKLLKTIGLIVGCFAMSIAVFCITYYLFLDKSLGEYERPVKKYISDISKINNSTSSLIKNNKLDEAEAKKDLADKIDSLTKIKNSITDMLPAEKYTVSHNSLISGLENNIMIFKQINEIIKNPQAKDIENALQDLKKYENDCQKFYSEVSIGNTKITLGSSCLTFIKDTCSYGSEQVSIRKDNEVSDSQNLDFINSIDSIAKEFSPLKVDVYSYVLNARNTDYDTVTSSINTNKTAINNIQGEFDKLSIPAKAVDVYKSLNTLIDNYEDYIQSINYAVDVEKQDSQGDKSLTSSDLDQLYSSANAKFTNFNDEYDKFILLFNSYKQQFANH